MSEPTIKEIPQSQDEGPVPGGAAFMAELTAAGVSGDILARISKEFDRARSRSGRQVREAIDAAGRSIETAETARKLMEEKLAAQASTPAGETIARERLELLAHRECLRRGWDESAVPLVVDDSTTTEAAVRAKMDALAGVMKQVDAGARADVLMHSGTTPKLNDRGGVDGGLIPLDRLRRMSEKEISANWGRAVKSFDAAMRR